MNEKLHICVLHLGFVYSGGGEKLVLAQSVELQKRGHTVDIFSPIVNEDLCFPDITSTVKIKQILPSFSFLPEWESLQVILTCLLAPFIAYRFRTYDIIFAANQPSPWIAMWVKLFFNVPYVSYLAQPTRFIYPRDIDKEEGLIFARKHRISIVTSLLRFSRSFTKMLDRVSVKKSAVVFSNGKYITNLITTTYSVKAIDVPAPTVFGLQKIINRKKKMKGMVSLGSQKIKKPYILVTNRHFPQKRFEYALFALQSLLSENSDYSLVITGGETKYTSYLRELASELSLTQSVIFTGLVDEKTLKRLYLHAYIYLYTAPEEDYGMGILEAMSSGVPVVAWDNAGPKYLISHMETGLKAKPLDLTYYISLVHDLVHSPKTYNLIQKNAYKEVASFQIESHVSLLETYIARYARNI